MTDKTESIRLPEGVDTQIELPDGMLGEGRYFGIEHTQHDDIMVSFWSETDDDSEQNVARFSMSHGSESVLLAAMVGYYRRLGLDDEQVKARLLPVVQSVLYDQSLEAETRRQSPSKEDFLGIVSEGVELPGLNQAVDGKCLVPIILARPGAIDDVGGTSIYTKEDSLGRQILLFAYVPPKLLRNTSNTDTITAELCEDDIPIVAESLCSITKGRYRQEMYNLLTKLYKAEGLA